jgi:hypothetical protein
MQFLKNNIFTSTGAERIMNLSIYYTPILFLCFFLLLNIEAAIAIDIIKTTQSIGKGDATDNEIIIITI